MESFVAPHVDLTDLAAERGVSTRRLRIQLCEIGIEPILPRARLNRLVYRRADL